MTSASHESAFRRTDQHGAEKSSVRQHRAGINVKALATFMGYAGIAITYDRYGHLMPGSEAEARGLLDAYLDDSAV